jgi:hypothetical protein
MAQTTPEFGARREDPRRAGPRELGLDEPAAYEWLRSRARAAK